MELSVVGFSIFWSVVLLQTSNLSSASETRGNDTDKLSLLAFKAQVQDPFGILNSWNESVDFCEWRGISCSRRHKRVTVLDLGSSQLKGTLSPHIGNMSFLRKISLENNSFTNHIPPEIGYLFRLREIYLFNNSFSGKIPDNISQCSNLEYLLLHHNNLTGKLPKDIGSLSKLEVLALGTNNFDGEIPTSFGNLSSAQFLGVQYNRLHGSIPHSFGQLKSLTHLALGGNNLSGIIPASIYNLSSIKYFAVVENELRGNLPHDLGHAFPNLEMLLFAANHFDGPIPITISNASNLIFFEIIGNNFVGKVPSFASSSNLRTFGIAANNLGYRHDDDLNFLSSLANCTSLETLYIAENNFGGRLPESVNNLSTKLQRIAFSENWIYGNIPTGIGNLISMEALIFEKNQLTGPIPNSVGKLRKLNWLLLNNNKLSGTIPSSLGNLTLLSKLFLHSNELQGSLPASLGQCKNLWSIALSRNKLTGPIPKQILGLSSLSERLDLSANQLTGPIPTEIGSLKNLASLNISENKLTGQIPYTIGSCSSLRYLFLEGNLLNGTIPLSLGSLRPIEAIDLSRNNLNGNIPVYLETFRFLQYLNLSSNDFEGEVPMKGVFSNASLFSMVGNTRLCGGIPQLNLSSCTTNLHKKAGKPSYKLKLIISIACGLVSLILVILLLIYYFLKKRSKSSNLESSFGISLLKVSYGDLFKATDGFSSTNLIGVGSFGSVYKGILNQEERQLVAVKVINLQTPGGSKSFLAECKALKSMKHRNLVRIITVCSSTDYQGNDFKALVYEFMVNGSLEKWLHPNNREISEQEHTHLSLIERVSICIDVANALDYLHNHYDVPIVHCDLKPSNVLLDSEMNARLGDFGLVRLLPNASHPFSSGQASSLGIRGSIGYVAPEYGMGSEVSTLGDVFSYGILLLEMFTGKSPTDLMFRDGLNLHNFALMGISTCVEEILDPMLLQREKESAVSNSTTHNGNGAKNKLIHDCLISIIKIGVASSSELQRERMDIANVVAELCHIKDRLVGT